MARLIDADALHKRLYKEFDHNSRLVGKQAVACHLSCGHQCSVLGYQVHGTA